MMYSSVEGDPLINVELKMNLKHLYNEMSNIEIPYQKMMRVDDLLNLMGIDPGVVSIILVNEELCTESKLLNDNDL